MNLFFNNPRGFVAATTVTLVASIIAGCGGGGSGSNPAPAPTAVVVAPTIAISTVAPVNGATNVATTVVSTFVFNYANATSISIATGDASTKCNGTSVTTLAAVTSNDTAKGQVTIAVTSTDMPVATACTVTVSKVTAVGLGGSTASLPTNTSFVTAAACSLPAMTNSLGNCISPPQTAGYTWNNSLKVWVADIGVLVSGARALPDACVNIADACWEASIGSGLVQFANSGMVRTNTVAGVTNVVPVVFAFYTAKINGVVNYFTAPIYSNQSSKFVSGGQSVTSGSGTSEVISDMKGTSVGLKQTASSGCSQKVMENEVVATKSISCPI